MWLSQHKKLAVLLAMTAISSSSFASSVKRFEFAGELPQFCELSLGKNVSSAVESSLDTLSNRLKKGDGLVVRTVLNSNTNSAPEVRLKFKGNKSNASLDSGAVPFELYYWSERDKRVRSFNQDTDGFYFLPSVGGENTYRVGIHYKSHSQGKTNIVFDINIFC